MQQGNEPTSGREVVCIYNNAGEIDTELHYLDFQGLLGGSKTLPEYAASRVKAAYCVVGHQLQISGVVFFMLTLREDGSVQEGFNIPLKYLVRQAGLVEFSLKQSQGLAKTTAPARTIRQASRSQCPVPWHSVNLWEPDGSKELVRLQLRLRQNRLALSINMVDADDAFYAQSAAPEVFDLDINHLNSSNPSDGLSDCDKSESLEAGQLASDIVESLASKVSGADRKVPRPEKADHPAVRRANPKANEGFGNTGQVSLQELIRLHGEQLEKLKVQFRQQRKDQRNAHLSQMNDAQNEIHKLRIALQQEQSRNRLLQKMLSGRQ